MGGEVMIERIKMIVERYPYDGLPSCINESGVCPWLRGESDRPNCGYIGTGLRIDCGRVEPCRECPYWADDVEVL
jgi:hypothetical protein